MFEIELEDLIGVAVSTKYTTILPPDITLTTSDNSNKYLPCDFTTKIGRGVRVVDGENFIMCLDAHYQISNRYIEWTTENCTVNIECIMDFNRPIVAHSILNLLRCLAQNSFVRRKHR